MISSLELNKNKNKNINQNIYNLSSSNNIKNINQNYYAQNNLISTQNQFGKFNKNNINAIKMQRNMSSGDNVIRKDMRMKNQGSQFNLNAFNKINNPLEKESLGLINENNSIKSPGNYNLRNINLSNNKSNVPISKKLNNFKAKVKPFNNNEKINLNTSPHNLDNMDYLNNNINDNDNEEDNYNNNELLDKDGNNNMEEDEENYNGILDNYINENNNSNNLYDNENENEMIMMIQITIIWKI
jgi:hypothetical protein